jgi:NTE family protein
MKTGLALSGGGARGIAHLGVVKAMLEKGIHFDVISGTSAGAVAGLFLAKGYSPDQALEIFTKTSVYKFLRPAINIRGLFKIGSVESIIKPYFGEAVFTDLETPFYVSATNVRTGKIRVFSAGELMRPVLASCCIPVVYEPMVIDNELYMDGGVVNNLPVEPLLGNVDRIVGVHCNPISDQYQGRNMRRLMERSLLLAINENVAARKPKCDLFIEPTELKNFHVFDFRKAKQIFQVGYDYASDLLSNKSVLSKLKQNVS